jgi:hypothetical protein
MSIFCIVCKIKYKKTINYKKIKIEVVTHLLYLTKKQKMQSIIKVDHNSKTIFIPLYYQRFTNKSWYKPIPIPKWYNVNDKTDLMRFKRWYDDLHKEQEEFTMTNPNFDYYVKMYMQHNIYYGSFTDDYRNSDWREENERNKRQNSIPLSESNPALYWIVYNEFQLLFNQESNDFNRTILTEKEHREETECNNRYNKLETLIKEKDELNERQRLITNDQLYVCNECSNLNKVARNKMKNKRREIMKKTGNNNVCCTCGTPVQQEFNKKISEINKKILELENEHKNYFQSNFNYDYVRIIRCLFFNIYKNKTDDNLKQRKPILDNRDNCTSKITTLQRKYNDQLEKLEQNPQHIKQAILDNIAIVYNDLYQIKQIIETKIKESNENRTTIRHRYHKNYKRIQLERQRDYDKINQLERREYDKINQLEQFQFNPERHRDGYMKSLVKLNNLLKQEYAQKKLIEEQLKNISDMNTLDNCSNEIEKTIFQIEKITQTDSFSELTLTLNKTNVNIDELLRDINKHKDIIKKCDENKVLYENIRIQKQKEFEEKRVQCPKEFEEKRVQCQKEFEEKYDKIRNDLDKISNDLEKLEKYKRNIIDTYDIFKLFKVKLDGNDPTKEYVAQSDRLARVYVIVSDQLNIYDTRNRSCLNRKINETKEKIKIEDYQYYPYPSFQPHKSMTNINQLNYEIWCIPRTTSYEAKDYSEWSTGWGELIMDNDENKFIVALKDKYLDKIEDFKTQFNEYETTLIDYFEPIQKIEKEIKNLEIEKQNNENENYRLLKIYHCQKYVESLFTLYSLGLNRSNNNTDSLTYESDKFKYRKIKLNKYLSKEKQVLSNKKREIERLMDEMKEMEDIHNRHSRELDILISL